MSAYKSCLFFLPIRIIDFIDYHCLHKPHRVITTLCLRKWMSGSIPVSVLQPFRLSPIAVGHRDRLPPCRGSPFLAPKRLVVARLPRVRTIRGCLRPLSAIRGAFRRPDSLPLVRDRRAVHRRHGRPCPAPESVPVRTAERTLKVQSGRNCLRARACHRAVGPFRPL